MKYFIVILSTLFWLQSSCQEEIAIVHYRTSKDFNLKIKGKQEVFAIIKESNEDFISVDKFINKETRKKNKKLFDCWAFQFNENYYFNLKYLGDAKLEGQFIKLDFIGNKFSYAFLEDSTLNEFKDKKVLRWVSSLGTSVINLGLASIDKALTSQHANWTTKEGNSKKILFINLSRENYNDKGIYNNLRAIYINKKQIAKMSGAKYKKSEWKELTFEFALETILTNDKG